MTYNQLPPRKANVVANALGRKVVNEQRKELIKDMERNDIEFLLSGEIARLVALVL